MSGEDYIELRELHPFWNESRDPNKEDVSDAFEEGVKEGYLRCKEEMLKNAIKCNVDWYDGPLIDYTQEQQDDLLEKIGAKVGDKVKVIFVKDE